MNQTFHSKLRTAAEEAFETFNKLQTHKEYVRALYLTQLFEVLLDTLYTYLVREGANFYKTMGIDYEPQGKDKWTIKDYLNRLETFFPRNKYEYAYRKLDEAMRKRNDFIHKCFKFKIGNSYRITLDQEKMHLYKNALKCVDEWLKAYDDAQPVIFSLMSKVKKPKKL